MSKPVLVGIAGGTGSGKTTVARKIKEGIGERCGVIQHDWYYHDQSDVPLEKRINTNYDHPASLDNELLVEHLKVLKSGRAVECPQYDFQSHARSRETGRVEPWPVVIVEGILIFSQPKIRELLDIKLFVDTAPDIRVMRRIRRDIRERGRDFESIRTQYYATVRPMHMQFVEPTKQCADLIIPEGGENRIALDVIVERLKRYLEPDP